MLRLLNYYSCQSYQTTKNYMTYTEEKLPFELKKNDVISVEYVSEKRILNFCVNGN